LGTLFHYLVKKDANVEAFRKRMQRLEDYSVQRALPMQLRTKLRLYFEFQYFKRRADDIKIFRSLPGSLQVKVASYQYSEVVLRNRALFRGCNGQFLNQVGKQPGEPSLPLSGFIGCQSLDAHVQSWQALCARGRRSRGARVV
jgi:hypothetical protein